MANRKTKNTRTFDIIAAGVCLALCMVLPFVTGQIPKFGSMLCPMHIPVLIAGFVCGPWLAMLVGALAPILRFFIFSMPPLMPVGLAMCLELASYGLIAGLLYSQLPKKTVNIYVSLIIAMIIGRIVWGGSMMLIMGYMGAKFTYPMFMSAAFTNAIPGMILHIVMIPAVVVALDKFNLINKRR